MAGPILGSRYKGLVVIDRPGELSLQERTRGFTFLHKNQGINAQKRTKFRCQKWDWLKERDTKNGLESNFRRKEGETGTAQEQVHKVDLKFRIPVQCESCSGRIPECGGERVVKPSHFRSKSFACFEKEKLEVESVDCNSSVESSPSCDSSEKNDMKDRRATINSENSSENLIQTSDENSEEKEFGPKFSSEENLSHFPIYANNAVYVNNFVKKSENFSEKLSNPTDFPSNIQWKMPQNVCSFTQFTKTDLVERYLSGRDLHLLKRPNDLVIDKRQYDHFARSIPTNGSTKNNSTPTLSKSHTTLPSLSKRNNISPKFHSPSPKIPNSRKAENGYAETKTFLHKTRDMDSKILTGKLNKENLQVRFELTELEYQQETSDEEEFYDETFPEEDATEQTKTVIIEYRSLPKNGSFFKPQPVNNEKLGLFSCGRSSKGESYPVFSPGVGQPVRKVGGRHRPVKKHLTRR